MSNNNNIPSPEEYASLEDRHHLGAMVSKPDCYRLMQEYADRVAAVVCRTTRHRAIEILNEEVANYVENEDQMGTIIGDKAGQRIINIPLRAVYPKPGGAPAGENQMCVGCNESPANLGLGRHKLLCPHCWNELAGEEKLVNNG